jgi:protein-L-isoaspartate(D-aspartate) O-methyltransferase
METQLNIRSYVDAYVDRLRAAGALRDPAVEQAFRRVPRHLFVERFYLLSPDGHGYAQAPAPFEHDPEQPQPEHLKTIYSDAALITRLEDNVGTSSSSQPGLMAQMLQLLELRPGMRVLEIGAGTGYNAALMADLVGDPSLVTTLDIQADVVEQAQRGLARAGCAGVTVLCRDGFAGAPGAAPFDRIVATVGCPDLSPRWIEQLAPSGFMLVPLRHAGANPLVRAWREGGDGEPSRVAGRIVGFSGFMAIQGALRDQRYYDFSPPPEAAEEQRPLWRELAPAATAERKGDADGPRLALWFYLGLRDPRARLFRWLSSFGLEDKPSGRSARVEGDRLVGDPALLDELEALYQEWRGLGSPAMGRYRLQFVPIGLADPTNPTDSRADSPSASQSVQDSPRQDAWVVAGTYYRRTFALRPQASA